MGMGIKKIYKSKSGRMIIEANKIPITAPEAPTAE